MNPTPFPNLDLPFVNTDTGRINKAWYQLLSSMYLLLGGTNPVSTPDLSVISGLMDENFAAATEIEKGLDALATGNAANDSVAIVAELVSGLRDLLNAMSLHDALVAQVAELKMQMEALELSAAFAPGVQVALNGHTTTTAPAAGSASALPATPAGYLTLNINGKAQQLPYY